MEEFLSLPGAAENVPVKILRDTGASDSYFGIYPAFFNCIEFGEVCIGSRNSTYMYICPVAQNVVAAQQENPMLAPLFSAILPPDDLQSGATREVGHDSVRPLQEKVHAIE
ncbi:hypothetical protein ROHU_001735 [Labeo rohita]|uniref:Uncharacterized protein n=1 Tax=Labeo rohita TaxID=84645 RepID=A0A498P1J2_LABRO|nr:hypothetical protein ROHU_001735 [Labeo rohita]